VVGTMAAVVGVVGALVVGAVVVRPGSPPHEAASRRPAARRPPRSPDAQALHSACLMPNSFTRHRRGVPVVARAGRTVHDSADADLIRPAASDRPGPVR
jgi:hypothetical protein